MSDDCRLAELLLPPHSARAWHTLWKNPISAGGLQQPVCDTGKAMVSNGDSRSDLPGLMHLSPSGVASRAAHALGTRASQLAATRVLGFQDTHQLPISLGESFSTWTLFALGASINHTSLGQVLNFSSFAEPGFVSLTGLC